MNNIFVYKTEIGELAIADNGRAITELYFKNKINLDGKNVEETKLIRQAYNEFNEYLSGSRKDFNIPLEPCGTEFQLKVWEALKTIPYGETCSYKEIAEKVNSPKAFRAVGLANNKNPISIFIPCHRVIGSNGKLVGYGGGLDVKEFLLNLEEKNS
ncbi:methylated-DNA--[protein]-cysteine S-methyltransferase [Clostridioides mangenotii]|uniref:methylated-DNA--[protein]-cysteine S-methyltransferase n=1 Tax=Metaclostridioides mangenotii TaxID=1540 RepID=UPI001C1209B4|nr:methylated-DNA--[protein]-cysteine S-methyltransferase [Clostridioides mangenotii]MBU5307413.1 methylated-DNA--[protein]-cysteine S-methyltransferase [Clostridioides mangenotii]MCR1954060.1 methylated-DNA--[protein]-cysteine S-methyltransferase [Clostridioides mangenotii]